MSSFSRLLLLVLALFLSSGAQASAGVQQAFDWQALWGPINFAGDASADPVIPSDRHPAKGAIRNAVSLYGTNFADLSLEKTYSLEINLDGVSVNGIKDVVLDGSAYFKKYPKASSTLCTATEGCYLTIYIQYPPTNIIVEASPEEVEVEETVTRTEVVPDEEAAPEEEGGLIGATATKLVTITETVKTKKLVDHACPAKASLNTTCDPACPADVSICPGLFQYNMAVAFDNRVFTWNFVSVNDFSSWYNTRATALNAAQPKGSIYQSMFIYDVKNTSPVLVVQMKADRCYQEEMIFNNNVCVKYFQYDSAKRTFVDLYSHPQYTGGDFGDIYTYVAYDRTYGGAAKGEAMGGGWGLMVPAHSRAYVQFGSFTRTNKDGTTYRRPAGGGLPEGFADFQIYNASDQNFFVPTNSEEEFNAFLNNLPPGLASETMTYKFTDWYGDLSCPSVGGALSCEGLDDQLGTGVSVTRTAQRFCQSATSAYMPCAVCVAAKAPGWENGCSTSRSCPGPACCIHGTYYAAGSYEACALEMAHHCLGGDQLVELPGGKTKPIGRVKAGDTLLGFDDPKGALKPFKVKSLAVTENEQTVTINDSLALTGAHSVLKEDGQPVFARDLQKGDKIVGKDGEPVEIQSVETDGDDKQTVYNVQLDKGGMGFVAGGVRVTSMPMSKREK